MLERIQIRNFQRWRKLDVTLERITTFVGPSDAGKSALVRWLRWICFNTPASTSFITHGESLASGRLVVDGQTITRHRGAGRNTYHLGPKKFKSFQRKVPQPIADLLNIREVNFQRQLDPPFWFEKSPGQVSRELNQIVDLGIIDRSLARSAAQVRRYRSMVEVSEARLARAKQEVRELDWVSSLDAALERLEALRDQLQKKEREAARLQQLLDQAKRYASASKDIPPSTAPLDTLARALEEREGAIHRLQTLLKKIQTAQETLCATERAARQAHKRLEKATQGRCPLCDRSLRRTKSAPSSSRTSI